MLARALRRFWAVALAAGLVAGLASWWAIASLTSTTYTATGLFIVPTATPAQVLAGSPLPEDVYEAEGLAQVYTLLLVDDAELLDALSTTTGVPVEDLQERVVAENVPSTPAIRVTYTGETEAEVREFFTSLEAVVTTTGSAGLAPGNLRALRLPTEVEELDGLLPVAPLVALVTGLLVGLAGAVLLERSDRRVQGPADLRDLSAWPVFDVREHGTGPRLETVALRLAGSGRPAVAVITTAASSPALAEVVADRLRRLPQDAFGALAAPAWVPAGQLQTDGYAEQTVLESGAALLVVAPSTRADVVDDALRAVADTGVADVALLLHDPVATDDATGAPAEAGRGRAASDEHGSTAAGAPTAHGARSVDR